MRRSALFFSTIVIGVGLALGAWISPPVFAPSPKALAGWPLYDRYCLPCHGASGDGRGPAAPVSAGRPRDFTKGEFAWRTTPQGSAPTRDDLRLTIRHGAPNTSMHASPLGDAEIDQLIEVVLAFAPSAKPGKPIALAAPPARDAERGKLLWTEKGCGTCHGPTGTG
ncbi:MAG: c-type cytochrome, partial [Deltaproteobacteria bacterium]|nr:c-type cytochrome [Deltaproteobacteria bacterium]